jgi:hypothetical protein
MIRRLFEQARRELLPEPPTIRREPIRRPTQPPPRAPNRESQAPPHRPSLPVASTRTSDATRALIRELSTRDGLRRAFVLTEILGPPVSMRDPRDGSFDPT